MGQEYNLNSTFGLNVSSRVNQIKSETAQNTNLESAIGEFVDSITGYSTEAEKVYSGDVEKEINMYSRQAMIVGMNLKNSEVKRKFDLNV